MSSKIVKRPHIVLFNPDEWRGDVLGHMGNPGAVTPNLDALVARDAVSFSNAFCQNPVCTPSRCSFMTGWYPHVRGHRTQYHMLRPDEPMLLKTLRDAGYFVWWGGKNDVVPGENGFSAYCDVKYKPPRPVKRDPHSWHEWRGSPGSLDYYSFYLGRLDHDPSAGHYYDGDWANVLGAIDFVRNAPKDKPLCIYLSLGNPHPPYAVEEPYYGMIDRGKVPARIPTPRDWSGKPSLLKGIYERQKLMGYTQERWTELRATYYGMCAKLDRQFGLLMDALRETGIYDDTAVFLFSDHGDFAGDYGLVEKTQNTFEDCLTRVPFIVKPPARLPAKPGVRDALVELVDMPATVEAVTGVSPGHTHFGRSLLPLVSGAVEEHRDAVFCEGGRREDEPHCAEVNAPAPHPPESLYWPRVALQERMPEHTKAVMIRTKGWKYVHRLYESDELYDLGSDPREELNIIKDPSASGILAGLKERLLGFLFETCDVVPRDFNKR